MKKEDLETIYLKLERVKKALMERRIEPTERMAYPYSFLNMQDFLSLKKFDLRSLQKSLSRLGLSSLTRSHFHLLYTIQKELEILSELISAEKKNPQKYNIINPAEAISLINTRASFLNKKESMPSIMLTLPSDAVFNRNIMDTLLNSHVDVVRINTAHDDPDTWEKMAEMIYELNSTARKKTPISIYVDLAGPKIRTGKLSRITRSFRTCTNHLRNISIVPSSIGNTCITSKDPESGGFQAFIAVEDDFYHRLKHADIVEINDHDRKPRYLRITKWSKEETVLECGKKVEISEKTDITIQISKKKFFTTKPVNFETVPMEIRLFAGDRILLSSNDHEGRLLQSGPYKAVVPCTLGDIIFPFVKANDPVFIDDGKIALKVITEEEHGLLCEVTNAKTNGTVLKEEKGINFPNTKLDIAAITQADLENFSKVVEFADIIGISFAQTGDDIRTLKNMLSSYPEKGIIAKIETNMGVHNLPMILTELCSWKNGGIMLARGDLAIEVGFENLAFVQEEIQNLCEAAHTPVIYATQILENMMKKNLPSRAEIIDASAAQRADCVMLNKGLYVKGTLDVLEHILHSMEHLFNKSLPQLSPLKEWEGFRDKLLEDSSL
ncbi:pyruvate kinase [Sulfurovum sp.]|uniref:pyruvate kinase n=1 Tax=Sulfurovum sp. TaxID=1969726 RepID=UPI0025E081EB|nr:pyruvate kinase [Sulfurovum sp.]